VEEAKYSECIFSGNNTKYFCYVLKRFSELTTKRVIIPKKEPDLRQAYDW